MVSCRLLSACARVQGVDQQIRLAKAERHANAHILADPLDDQVHGHLDTIELLRVSLRPAAALVVPEGTSL